MNRKYALLTIFLGFIIVFAFVLYLRQKTETVNSEGDPISTQQEESVFDASKIKKETFADTSNLALEIKGEYPVGVVGAEYVEGMIDAKLAAFKAENDPARFSSEEMMNFGPSNERPYSFTTMYKAYTSGTLLTHRMDIYTYIGGAHGNTVPETYTYTAAGKQVAVSDLFVDQAAIVKFSDLVKQKALAMPEYKDMINTEWLADSAGPNVVDYKVFAFDGKNLTIIFPQYSIAPYVAGIIEVPIPFSELQGIVKAEYLK